MDMNQNYLLVALQLLGSLGLLIYGMRMMSEALQKMAGPQLRHILAKMTTNRITGMLTGTLVTCAVLLHGGNITVSNSDTGGLAFEFTIKK